jgi:site-specific DNA recombinase
VETSPGHPLLVLPKRPDHFDSALAEGGPPAVWTEQGIVGLAPYGYQNKRIEGRSVVVADERRANNVMMIFDLYAHHNCTIDGVIERLREAGIKYTDDAPDWCRAKVHNILRDRAYIGELRYKGQWYKGSQTPIVGRHLWDRVQTLLGEGAYKSHELTYAGGLIRCGHCGNVITGESVVKKQTGKQYVYYRCSTYKSPGHPNVRITEGELDEQMMNIFGRLQQEQAIREWFHDTLRLWTQHQQRQSRQTGDHLQRDLTLLREQQDRLLNLRLLGEIEADTFARKNTELRDRVAKSTLQLEATARSRDELAEVAMKLFELSQALPERWLIAKYDTKRRFLKMIFSNFVLDGATLTYEMIKPFDALAKGLFVHSSRGD